ncbi:MAG: sigma-70 family RNA polymerase sigma factor, partial [Bacteroidota bacterium]
MELYRRYFPLVRGVCRRYAEEQDQIDDWVNRSFLRGFSALKQYDGKGPFGAWLRRVSVNVCIDELRRSRALKRREPKVDQVELTVLVSPAALERLALADLVTLIQQLPVMPRTVFNLYAVEGYSHREIAKRLKLSQANSRYFFRRSRLLLQSLLQNQNFFKCGKYSKYSLIT